MTYVAPSGGKKPSLQTTIRPDPDGGVKAAELQNNSALPVQSDHSSQATAALANSGITARIRPPLRLAGSSRTFPRNGNTKTLLPALAGKEISTFRSGICFEIFRDSSPLKLNRKTWILPSTRAGWPTTKGEA